MPEGIAKLEAHVRQLEADMSVLSEAMAEILAWSKEAEKAGFIPVQVRGRARTALKLSKNQAEMETLQEIINILHRDGEGTLYESLQSRLLVLQGRREEYRSGLDG